ncbi:hypothetical protein A6R68_12871, partial [Neotoma lepida]
MIDANEEKTPEQTMQEKHMEVKIEDLENEIKDVKSNSKMKTLILNRMNLSGALKNNMEKVGTESSVLTDDGLILGSKINWAEDSALREIVLQLEKNLTTI